MNENEIIGKRLQQYREIHKVTQQEMAEATGHSKNYISALEHGTNKMAVPTLIAYADKLNMSIDELLGRTSNNIIPELKILLADMAEAEQHKLVDLIILMRK